MATVTKVNKSELRGLYVALGSEAASEWSDKRLLSKLEGLSGMAENEEAIENLNKTQKKLLKSLLAAQKEDEEFELVDDDEAKEEGAPKPKAKAAAPAEDDEEVKPKAKKEEGATVKRQGPPKSAGGEGRPGIIASIKEFLGAASEEKPLTKAAIVAKLAKRFTDRDEEAMSKTVAVQVPNRLKKDGYGIESKQTDDGKAYWIEVMPAGEKKAKSEKKAEGKSDTKKKAAVPEDDD